MKKYIFIPSLAYGGAEKVVASLFKNSAIRNNCDLLLINNITQYSKDNVKIKILTINRFFKLMLSKKPMIIQCHLVIPLLLGSLLKLFNQSIQLQAVHCFSYEGYIFKKNFFIKAIFLKILKLSNKLVDVHIFKSIDMVDDFKKIFNFVPNSYSIIHNPIDLNRGADLDKNIAINIESKGKINVAILGRVCKKKGSYEIFDLARICDDRFVFNIIGDGPAFKEISNIAKNYTNICVHGRLNNPFNLLSKCKIYLSFSYNEGFPNALVESMALGLYPIHSNCKTGPRELLEGSKNYEESQHTSRGFLFPPGNISSCNDGLNKYLLLSESSLNKILEDNRELTNKFEYNQILNKYLKVLSILN